MPFGLAAGKTEAQPCRMLGETPHHDAGLAQRLKHAARVLASHQAEQRGAANHLEPRPDETRIELQRRLGEFAARPLPPVSIGAAAPIASAALETGQGPSAVAMRVAISGAARAKLSLRPGRP